jgi:hypothetical protein
VDVDVDVDVDVLVDVDVDVDALPVLFCDVVVVESTFTLQIDNFTSHRSVGQSVDEY